MKTVVTLTSWKNRIKYLHDFLFVFFKTQLEKPDIFYIWLSIDEFPNKEKDLDDKLVKFISDHNINLMWLNGNDTVFKRWNVFPKHLNDIVISIDDDRVYPFHLISDAKQVKSGTIQNLMYLEKERYYLQKRLLVLWSVYNSTKYFPNRMFKS